MRNFLLALSALTLLVSVSLIAQSGPSIADQWPAWRGPTHDGVSTETDLPTTWSATHGVDWKLPLPSYSGSTPIIWDNFIFLNVATSAHSGDLELWAVDRNKKDVVWKRHIAAGNHVERKQNMSSPSPVTDGTHVWVMTGVGILKAFDFEGKELWTRDIQKDYGRFGLNWGYASSPRLHDGALYVQVLHGMKTDAPSYVLKIDAMTGKTIWHVERPTNAIRESPDAYTTPAIIEHDGLTELIITGGDAVTSHDLATGKELWRADGLNPGNRPDFRTVASAIFAGGLIIVPVRDTPLYAFRPGGRGDVSSSHLVWAYQSGVDVPSPVSDGERLYVVNDRGIVHCLDLKTGKVIYGPTRLPSGTYSASPVLADGKIYATSEEDGITRVFRAGPKFELLASNSLDNDCNPYCLSSLAISQGQLFLKTSSHLWVIGQRRR